MKIIQEHGCLYFGQDVHTLQEIPIGFFLLCHNEHRGFYLKSQDNITLPKKIYGDTQELVDKYLNSFKNSSKNIGVLLTGQSGGGKTLLAKCLSVYSKMPTIIISERFEGADFHAFLSQIEQPCVVLFDEFEKIYIQEQQNELLSILDGFYSGKKLFVFTSNTKHLCKFLLNRPGRIRYAKHFEGLTDTVIQEISTDILKDKDNAAELLEIARALGQISYDSLISLIQEMNLYSCTAREAISFLNITPENARYKVSMIYKGKHYNTQIETHPLFSPEYSIPYRGDSEAWWEHKTYCVVLADMDIMYMKEGKIQMNNTNDQCKLVFEKIRTYNFEI